MKLKSLGKAIRDNKSIILSCLGIGGFVLGTVKASANAYEAGQERRPVKFKDLAFPIVVETLSAASILTGNMIDRREKKMLAASYILMAALRGKQQTSDETDALAKKAAEDLHLGKNLDEYHYFHDPVSNQVFYTDMKTVLGAEFLVNRQLSIFGVVNAEDWPYFLGIEVTDDNAINLIDKGWDASIIDEFFQSPGIEFAHIPYDKDYICVLPDGSEQCIPKEDILEIVMNVYPRELGE